MKLFCLATLSLCLSTVRVAQASLYSEYLTGIQISYQVAEEYPVLVTEKVQQVGDSVGLTIGQQYPAEWMHRNPADGKLLGDTAHLEMELAPYRENLAKSASDHSYGMTIIDISDPVGLFVLLRCGLPKGSSEYIDSVLESFSALEKNDTSERVLCWKQGLRRGMFTQKCECQFDGYSWQPEQFWSIDSARIFQVGEQCDWARFMIVTSDLTTGWRGY